MSKFTHIHTAHFSALRAQTANGGVATIYYHQKAADDSVPEIHCVRLSPAASSQDVTVAEIRTIDPRGYTDITIVKLAAPIVEVKMAYQIVAPLPVVDETSNYFRYMAQKMLSLCGLSLTDRYGQEAPRRPPQGYRNDGCRPRVAPAVTPTVR